MIFDLGGHFLKNDGLLGFAYTAGFQLEIYGIETRNAFIMFILALYQIWHLYPPREHIPPFDRLNHCTNISWRLSGGLPDIAWLSTDDSLAAAAVVSGLVVAHRTNPQRSAEGFTSGPLTAHRISATWALAANCPSAFGSHHWSDGKTAKT